MSKKIVFCGLDSAGKTSIIKTLQEGEQVQTSRTIGFAMNQLEINQMKIQTIDLGGQAGFREAWGTHLSQAGALIWVIDASDSNRFNEVVYEFQRSLFFLPKDAIILVLANKQDRELAEDTLRIKELLKLKDLGQKWNIFKTSTITTEGLRDAFSWLYESISGETIELEVNNYQIPVIHLADGTFKCVYLEGGMCPTPDRVPQACPTCIYGTCQNCLNQVPECLSLFPQFFNT